ncbi:MAG: protease HtpX [Betaproteobacteria bacterium]|nr:protease HtpX [Betaproteobacteria bacterium]
MKRVLLLIATNFAVVLLLSVVASVLGIDQWLNANGINFGSLLLLSLLMGFGGSFISLIMSKWIAKMSTGARTIDGSEGTNEYWLVQTVHKLADEAGVGHPEVAIYDGPPNAFATGAFKNDSLVAVSTGLLDTMSREEVEAVLGHEMTHVSNGDMVTLTLVQGVVNTFVIFLSRVVGLVVDKAVFRTERGVGPGFYVTVMVCQLLFGILASLIVAWFSRRREFRADAGSAKLLGTPRPMIAALKRLGGLESGGLPDSVKAFGINSESGLFQLFATHPPIEVRIAALEARQ